MTTKMKKKTLQRIISWCLMAFLLVSGVQINGTMVNGVEEKGNFVLEAISLKNLGLFQGTANGFELTKVSTRAEAAVMLVRLLGAEKTALENESMVVPFKDVPTWAAPHVAYLYAQKLVKGKSETLFGSNDVITMNQYTTMVLRALGYSENSETFTWQTAAVYGEKLQIMKALNISQPNIGIDRDTLAKISYNCLFAQMNGLGMTLLSNLYQNFIVTQTQLNTARLADPAFATYTDLPPTQMEIKGVWISYLDLQALFKNKTEATFRAATEQMLTNVSLLGLNTVMLQVRPFADAIYPSKLFPWSYLINGTEGVAPTFDPLQIFIEVAHEKDLQLDAWLNPYRIRTSTASNPLSINNIATTWQKSGNLNVIAVTQGALQALYFNPGVTEVQDYIVSGIQELLNNYDLDGIHFDDYFYPSTDLTYDQATYQAYLNGGGAISQADWRRENVNTLIRKVYATIKTQDPNCRFGISPQASLANNYNHQYSDVAKWATTTGYVDYLCPQIYFGFLHQNAPYEKSLDEWANLITANGVKLYVGLAPYKLGIEDKYAGTGKTEWQTGQQLLSRMVESARLVKGYGGFLLFRYDSIWKPSTTIKNQVDLEIESLKSILAQ